MGAAERTHGGTDGGSGSTNWQAVGMVTVIIDRHVSAFEAVALGGVQRSVQRDRGFQYRVTEQQQCSDDIWHNKRPYCFRLGNRLACRFRLK